MSDAVTGEIRMFAGTKPPSGWHLCDGTLLPVAANEVLFTLIGKTYGGDGINNFAVPDMRSRIPVGVGTGTGLTPRTLGQTGGQEQVALDATQMPAHNHVLMAAATNATLATPGNSLFATSESSTTTAAAHYLKAGATVSNTWALNGDSVAAQGSGAAHENRMVSGAVNYIICLSGYFPNFN